MYKSLLPYQPTKRNYNKNNTYSSHFWDSYRPIKRSIKHFAKRLGLAWPGNKTNNKHSSTKPNSMCWWD